MDAVVEHRSYHRRSQGVQWVHLHPPSEKFFSGLIYRKNV